MIFGDNAKDNKDISLYGNTLSASFTNCTGIQSVDKNFLPATKLSHYCYQNMFRGCTSLINAPALPATTLTDYCYASMFSNCTSLTTAPELPATTLTNWCYEDMFYGCNKLNYIKMLATDVSATYCLYNWVYNVAAAGTFVKNPAMTSLRIGDTSGIPRGWTVKNDGDE